MEKNVLFISNTNLANPILHSQGLPLLEYASKNGFKTHFVSINSEESNFKSDLVAKIKRKYSSSISFHEITINSHKFLPGWINIIYFGSYGISKIVSLEKIQIIHARSLFPAILGLFAKTRSTNKTHLIYDNRGLYIDESIYIGRWKKNSLKVFFLYFFERVVFKKSEAVILVSSKFKQFIIKKYSQNISKKLHVINNKTKISSIVEQPNDKNVFVYVGSAAKWYCVENMFNLFVEVKKQIFNSKFIIITYESENFSNVTKKYQCISNDIKFLNIFSDEVNSYLVKCNVGVMLREQSIFTEVSAPLKFAEYLNAGLPVLINEGVGDTERIINKYNVGVIIKNNDYKEAVKKIRILLKDPQIKLLCNEVAKKEFDQQQAFVQYLEIYEKLLKNE